MDNTINQQGSFTSDGSNINIVLRSDIDWMMVYNQTQAAASQTTAVGVKYYWQRGFAAGSKWVMYKSNAANAANLDSFVTSAGFTLIDTSLNPAGVINATVTAVSSASIPVVSNSGTNGLVAGDVVRMTNVVGAQQLGGFDFTVGYNTLTTGTFSLDYMSQIVAGTTGSWTKIKYNPMFYPRRRYITNITQATNAVVTMSVTHQYQVGQTVRMVVPVAYGMSEMNGLLATIIAINTSTTVNSITLDIDSTTFTAFAWPITTQTAFTPAEVVPVGENTSVALELGVDILSDATINDAYIGMTLTGGVSCPGGAANDVMYWVAGKSFSVSVD